MKCKKCGHTAKTIGAMAAHYRKSHPGSMKAKKPRRTKAWKPEGTHAGLNPYQMVYQMIKDHEDLYHK